MKTKMVSPPVVLAVVLWVCPVARPSPSSRYPNEPPWQWAVEPQPVKAPHFQVERAGGKTFSCGLLCEIQPIEGEEPVSASLTQVNVFPLGVAPGKPDITYRLVGFDTNGKRLSQSGGGSVSSGPLRMQIVMMEVEPPAKLAAIGIEYLTPEARKQRIAEQLRNLKTHGIRLSEPIVGKPFAFSLPVPEGRTVDHHQLAGKVVLMSLWASW